MSESTAVVTVEPVRVELGVIRADRPAELVKLATEAANALAALIEAKGLFSNIQGKKFVRCEGWTTLAAMLGATPHEISVTEHEGAYTATVELRRLSDGQPISRASAECGPDEATWKPRPRYARRSMALTRATAKACRLAFSWIMALSGYEVTPSEEIPDEERGGKSRTGKVKRATDAEGPRAPVSAPNQVSAPTTPTATQLSDVPAALKIKDGDPLKGEELDPPTWPFGDRRGELLTSFSTVELAAGRKWLLKKSRTPDEFQPLLDAIDDILASRDGVVE